MERRQAHWARALRKIMLARFLAIWLSAAVFACPFTCKAGLSCAAEKIAAPESPCCDHCDDEESSRPQNSDDPSRPCSEDSCQCICGGALFEQVEQVSLSFLVVPSIALALFDDGWAAAIRGLNPDAFSVLPTLGSMNPGRAVCCQFSVFLC
jgi:hypothetical protein